MVKFYKNVLKLIQTMINAIKKNYLIMKFLFKKKIILN